MTDKLTMSVAEAVEVLKRECSYHLNHHEDGAVKRYNPPTLAELAAALAALEGVNIYGSRFKVGDESWYIGRSQTGKWCVGSGSCKVELRPLTMILHDPPRLYPTRDEAESECARRNKEQGHE